MREEKKDLITQEKKEVQTEKELTVPGKKYLPTTDIVETEKELLLYMDMPGVNKDNVQIKLEKNILAINGKIDANPYTGLKPIYTEYNIGHFIRRFELSNEIDQSKIDAKMAEGVLLLTLPKTPAKQPKLIQVN